MLLLYTLGNLIFILFLLKLATFNTVAQRPANRSVVTRGFIKDKEDSFESDLLCITTDVRSSKVEQLSSNPGFEICW